MPESNYKKQRSTCALQIVGAVLGLALMYIMANAYVAMVTIPAWSNIATVLLFIAGDIAMGFVLVGFFENALYEKCAFNAAAIIAAAAAIVSFVFEMVLFCGLGLKVSAFVIGAILVAAGAVVIFVARKKASAALAIAAFACVIIGVLIARFAFYAVA